MFQYGKSMSRVASLTLLWVLYGGIANCKEERTFSPQTQSSKNTREDVEMTKEEVIASLKAETLSEFCVVGMTKDGTQLGLSKTPLRFADLYSEGKFWVQIRSDSGISSEFYNDADLAMKALTDRGVVKFRTCPKPFDL